MKILWHQKALDEFEQSACYYESKSSGLGERFIEEIEKTISLISYDPQAPRIFEHGCRKLNLHRFPYSIVYLVGNKAAELTIVAVMNQARLPGYWIGRID